MGNIVKTINQIKENQANAITQVVKLVGELNNLYLDLNNINGQLNALSVILQTENNKNILLSTIKEIN